MTISNISGTNAGWLRRCGGPSQPETHIVCFPHAGGSASFFRRWGAGAADTVAVWTVQYPGREDRILETPVDDLVDIARQSVAAILPLLDRTVVLFGHSMGATVAYETLRRIEHMGPTARTVLAPSASVAPSRRRPADQVDTDQQLVAQLRRLGGSSAEVLDDPEVLKLVLPAYRNDLQALRNYRHRPLPMLRSPVVAFGGADDPDLTEEDVLAWRECTTGSFASEILPGGHFYLTGWGAHIIERLHRLRDEPASERPGGC